MSNIEMIEIVYALEGSPKPHEIGVPAGASNPEVLALIVAKHALAEPMDLYWEDEDEPLAETILLLERLRDDFRQVHVARPGKIDVDITYNHRTVHHRFRPNATIRRVIVWAISDAGLDLVGKPADFQIKFEGKVVPPETHLGQLAACEQSIALSLVANIKPQG